MTGRGILQARHFPTGFSTIVSIPGNHTWAGVTALYEKIPWWPSWAILTMNYLGVPSFGLRWTSVAEISMGQPSTCTFMVSGRIKIR